MTHAALRTTPLHAVHQALGAKMVAFAGWDMPLAYGSQLEEHHQARRDAVMFDVSHMQVVDIWGEQARTFLQWLLANDAARLAAPGRALYSCMLNHDGGVLDDLIVYYRGGNRYRLVVNAGTAEQDCAWIAARRDERAPGVVVEPRRALAIIAVQGPRARARTWAAHPPLRAASHGLAPFHAADASEVFVARTGYTGEDGFELILPAAQAVALWQALAAQGVAPAGLGARDTLRLEAGLNLYGKDMDETVTPPEAGLAWTVALDATRDFIGKAALLARPPQYGQLGLVLLDKGVMRDHQRIRCHCGAGEITSGGYSPTLNRSIALARLPRAAAAGDAVEVEVRGNWLRARTVKPPFVRQGKALISIEC